MSNTCRIRAGRLMEIDVSAGYRTLQDVDAMMGMIKSELARIPASTRVIIAADWRPCTIFTPEVADRAKLMLTGANARIERSAILHRENHATSVLQVLRLVREANFPERRLFTDPRAMEGWLDELLTAEEKDRLRAFLGRTQA